MKKGSEKLLTGVTSGVKTVGKTGFTFLSEFKTFITKVRALCLLRVVVVVEWRIVSCPLGPCLRRQPSCRCDRLPVFPECCRSHMRGAI